MISGTKHGRRVARPWKLASAVATILLSPAYTSALAQDVNTWEGDSDSEVTNEENWSLGFEEGLQNVVIKGGTPNDPVWTIGGPSASGRSTAEWISASLVIGNGPGTTGHMTIVVDPDYADADANFQWSASQPLLVGADGGNGTLDITLHSDTRTAPGVVLSNVTMSDAGLVVGLGEGSAGVVNLRGWGVSGRSAHPLYRTGAGELHTWVGSHLIGSAGGTGTFTIEDAGWYTRAGAINALSGGKMSPLGIGVGEGSNGTVNVLSGGSMSLSVDSLLLQPAVRIGAEGGDGTLTVSGADAGGYASNALFALGLDIGRDSDSTGSVNVLAGGMMLNFVQNLALNDDSGGGPKRLPPPPVQLGVDGGTGRATVSGADSIWYVGAASGNNFRNVSGTFLKPITDGTQLGHLHVGVSGTGRLTIAEGGVVALGTAYVGDISDSLLDELYYGLIQFDEGLGTLFLGETASGNGSLNLGAAAGETAVAPGELQAAQVQFGPGAGTVVFNHTAADYVFDTPLVGTGTLAQYAGTTWLQAPATPPDGAATGNSGFGGVTELHGGALGLGYRQALGGSAVQVIADAGLIYADAVGIGNGVELQGSATLTASVDGGAAAGQSGVISGSGQLAKAGDGILSLAGINTYTGQTLVSGGVLALAGDGSVADSSRVVADAVFDVSGASGDAFIRSLAGTGAVDVGGHRLTLTAAGDTFAGQFTGTGAFAVDAGREVLTGDSSAFAGATFVDGGELWVNGSLGTAATTTQVNDGGLLGGSGRIGGHVNVAGGGTLTPGAELGAPGVLTIDGDLTLSSGARLRYQFGQANTPGGAFNDLLTVGGDLLLDGTLDVNETVGGVLDPGVYRVIDYGGTLTNLGLELGTLPPIALDLSVQTGVANQVNLVLAPLDITLNFWDGAAGPKDDGQVNGGDGIWQSDVGNDNWTDANGTVNAPYANGSFATFLGEPGTVTVDASLGGIFVEGMQFATSGYLVRGDSIELLGPEALVRVGTGALAQPDYLTVVAEHQATIESALTGDARLVKADEGSLILAGQNSYTGGTFIREGLVQIADDGALGQASGDVRFGVGALRTTATLESARAVSIDTMATLLPQAGTTLTLSGTISGSGEMIKAGTGSLHLTGDSSLTGPTSVFAGTLLVDGRLAESALSVYGPATLGGTGTVGATTLASGATIAPGHSIGTLSVNGDYVQQAGARYVVEVDPTSTASDLIAVSGTGTLADGAQLDVVRTVAAPYVVGHRYTVLSTGGGLSGQYTLSGDLAVSHFLALSDIYDADNAYLEVTQTRSLVDINCAGNAGAAAGGAAGLPITNTLGNALLNSPDEASACDALGQLSGEIHASARSALLEDSRFLREAVGIRIRGASQAATIEPGHEAAAGNGAWAHVFGSWGRFDHGDDARRLDRDISGLFLGIDRELAADWRLGAVAGYSHSNFDVDAWRSSASSDDYHLGVYAGRLWDNGLAFHGGLAYTRHDIQTTRNVDFPLYSDRLRADYDASTRQAYAEFGYRFNADQLVLHPFLNVAHVQLRSDAFQEQGGEAALRADGDRDDLTYAILGMRLGRTFDTTGGTRVNARAMVGWRHAFGDREPDLAMAFASGGSFVIEGVPIARDALALELGLEAAMSDTLRIGGTYSGQMGGGIDDHGAKLYLAWKF